MSKNRKLLMGKLRFLKKILILMHVMGGDANSTDATPRRLDPATGVPGVRPSEKLPGPRLDFPWNALLHGGGGAERGLERRGCSWGRPHSSGSCTHSARATAHSHARLLRRKPHCNQRACSRASAACKARAPWRGRRGAAYWWSASSAAGGARPPPASPSAGSGPPGEPRGNPCLPRITQCACA